MLSAYSASFTEGKALEILLLKTTTTKKSSVNMLNVLFFPETKLDCFLAGATRVPYNVMLLILEILTSVYLRMPFSVHQVF